jgi:hypothetical protein
VFGLFLDREIAEKAAQKLSDNGVPAVATETLTRERYWKEMFQAGHRDIGSSGHREDKKTV